MVGVPALERLDREDPGDEHVDPVDAMRMMRVGGRSTAQPAHPTNQRSDEQHARQDLDDAERELESLGAVLQDLETLEQQEHASHPVLQLLHEERTFPSAGSQVNDDVGRDGHARILAVRGQPSSLDARHPATNTPQNRESPTSVGWPLPSPPAVAQHDAPPGAMTRKGRSLSPISRSVRKLARINPDSA